MLSLCRAAQRGGWPLIVWCFAAVATAVFASAGAADARSGPRAFTFQVEWSLFPNTVLASGRFVMREDGGGYQVDLEAAGDHQALRNRSYALETSGERSRRSRQPRRFVQSRVRPEMRESFVVSWERNASRPQTTVRRSAEAPDVDRDPVDPARIRDVVDPLTFLTLVIDRVEATNGDSCDVAERTWDGELLADVEIRTLDRLEAARIDCRIVYKSVSGMRKNSQFRVNEGGTMRVARFEKVGGEWSPTLIRIDADLFGMRTTFVTRIRRIEP